MMLTGLVHHAGSDLQRAQLCHPTTPCLCIPPRAQQFDITAPKPEVPAEAAEDLQCGGSSLPIPRAAESLLPAGCCGRRGCGLWPQRLASPQQRPCPREGAGACCQGYPALEGQTISAVPVARPLLAI